MATIFSNPLIKDRKKTLEPLVTTIVVLRAMYHINRKDLSRTIVSFF